MTTKIDSELLTTTSPADGKSDLTDVLERQHFEAWASSKKGKWEGNYDIRKIPGGAYIKAETRCALEAWIARSNKI